MQIQPDFSQVAEITPGNYTVRIADAKHHEKTDTQGNPQNAISWGLQIFDNEDTRLNGQWLWHYTIYQGQYAGMFKTFYKQVTGEDYVEGQAFDTEDFLGTELEVTTAADKKDPTRTNVKSARRLSA